MKTDSLQRIMDRAVENGEIAGANLLILQDSKEIAYVQAGFADVERRIPYSRNTICRMYSMTKPITGAAAMILMERGLLDLSQPVGEIIPEFRKVKVWEEGKAVVPKRPLIVKDLLSMTSGLPYCGTDPAGIGAAKVESELCSRLHGDYPMTTMECAGKIASAGLAFHPGDSWMYGTSADVMGAVIEKISGMTFGEFLKKELFDPMEMSDTGFYVPTEKQDRLACVYEQTELGMELFKTNSLGIDDQATSEPAFQSGGAGLFSTLDDYAKFASMLMEMGRYREKQIIAPGTVKYFTGGKLTPWQQESFWRGMNFLCGYSYGNFLRVMQEPGMAQFGTWKGEYGWDGWLGTYFCNSPENGITILFSTQKKDAGTTKTVRCIRNTLMANL